MSKAAASRGASLAAMAARPARFRAAAGALAVLFARSYGRAEDIHRPLCRFAASIAGLHCAYVLPEGIAGCCVRAGGSGRHKAAAVAALMREAPMRFECETNFQGGLRTGSWGPCALW